ncbi:MAG: hypothetical protein R3A80_04735 [Bdellovibrionota bacterium]
MRIWVQLFMYSFWLFLVLAAGPSFADSSFFYKDKFPGSTCVPLSFYISTQLGADDAKGFWSQVEGATQEEKFDKFLNECSDFYRPAKKSGGFFKDENTTDLQGLFDAWEDYDILRWMGGFAPIFVSVEKNGMWLEDLLKVIRKLNPHYVNEMKLEYRGEASFDEKGVPPNVRLYYLRKKLERSLRNKFSPVVTWNNLSRNSSTSAWTRSGGHATTLVALDDTNGDAYDSRLGFIYIDNEDGKEHHAYFYMLGDEERSDLEEIDYRQLGRIHVSNGYTAKNKLFTLNGALVSAKE